MSAKVYEAKGVRDRLMLELQVAESLSTSDMKGKIKQWFEAVLPRIERNFPEMLAEDVKYQDWKTHEVQA